MSPPGAATYIGLLLALLMVQLPPQVAFAEEAGPPPCAQCLGRGVKTAAPFVRIAVTEVGMLVAAGAAWPEGYTPVRVRVNVRQFAKSWTEPPEFHFTRSVFASDNDWWYFNVFAHGLFGSEAYLAGRGIGHGPTAAFGYALFASFTWEYLVEGFFKQPSAIDLFWTPAAGALLGELRYQALRLVSRKVGHRPSRLALQLLLDPIGKLQRLMLGCRD